MLKLTKGYLSKLLNGSAQRMSQSYLLDERTIQDAYETMIRQQEQPIHTLLNTFFVPSLPKHHHHAHRHKRRKVLLLPPAAPQPTAASPITHTTDTGTTDTTTTTTNTTTDGTTNTVQQRMTIYMMEQKRLIRERYQLLLLPSRG